MGTTNGIQERRLWSDLLELSVADLSHEDSYIRSKAETWFKETRQRKFTDELCDIEGCDPQIGSFLWVCMVLGIDPDSFKKKLNL